MTIKIKFRYLTAAAIIESGIKQIDQEAIENYVTCMHVFSDEMKARVLERLVRKEIALFQLEETNENPRKGEWLEKI